MLQLTANQFKIVADELRRVCASYRDALSALCNQSSAMVHGTVCLLFETYAVRAGDNESSALIKEMKRMKQMRPLTHDVVKELLW